MNPSNEFKQKKNSIINVCSNSKKMNSKLKNINNWEESIERLKESLEISGKTTKKPGNLAEEFLNNP